MKRIYTGICAASLALSFMGSAVSVAHAAPLPLAKVQAADESVHKAQYRRDRDRNRFERRRVERPRFERRGGWAYYNGHRGYREYRRGYRRHNGWWFPPGAFVAGAIIGGAMASPPTVVVPAAPIRLSAAHVRWCQNRWKSYRVSDNSYQPFNGPRQACTSPYGG